jgi:hypothetical protein
MSTLQRGGGTKDDPWVLKTPPLTSDYKAWREDEVLWVQASATKLFYKARAIEDLHAMLLARGDWVALGNADEGKPAAEGSVEAWARAADNPVGGYYGLRRGYRGRFANYVTPVLETLGLVELEHEPRNNRVRAATAAD